MKRFLIIPATAALLTGLSVSAQETNDNPETVNTPAEMISTQDQADPDEMTIDELNAMQLQKLQMASTNTTATADTSAPMDTLASETMDMADETTLDEPGAHETISDQAETDTATSMPDDSMMADETDMSDETSMAMTPEMAPSAAEMGGPDYTSETDAMADAGTSGTIADVAMQDARFSTLAALVKQAGLDAELSDTGPYTVFAPTNEAFDKLDPELVARLTSGNANDELATLLKSHVVEGKYLAEDISEGETDLTTLASTHLEIERSGDMVTADDVDIVTADIGASNGVIHAVDSVIMPVAQGDAAMEDEMEAETEMETDNSMDTETGMDTETEMDDPGQ